MREEMAGPVPSPNHARLSDAMAIGAICGGFFATIQNLAMGMLLHRWTIPPFSILWFIPLLYGLISGPFIGIAIWRVRPVRRGSLAGLVASRAILGGLVGVLVLIAWGPAFVATLAILMRAMGGMEEGVDIISWISAGLPGFASYSMRRFGLSSFAWGSLVGVAVAPLTWIGGPWPPREPS